MTKWDALLLNTLAAVCSDPIGHLDQVRSDIALATYAAARATVDNPMMAELAMLAGQFESLLAERQSARWSRLKLDAGLAVSSALRRRSADLNRQLAAG